MANIFSSRAYKLSVGHFSAIVSFGTDKRVLGSTPEEPNPKLHFHTQYELFFSFDDSLVMKFEGGERAFSKCALCVAPFTRHCVKQRRDVLCLRLEVKNANDSTFVKMLGEGVCRLTVSDFCFSCVRRLFLLEGKRADLREQEATALLRLIFLDLYETNVGIAAVKETAAVDDYCMVIDHFVNVCYAENITLATVAAALHLSTKQTSRIIRAKYHATLSQLLREKRLEVAGAMLRGTDRSVTEIAEELFGRADNTFFRIFREKYGVSPLLYRKQAK